MRAVGCFAPPADQVETYSGFFFGAKRLGSAVNTAKCADCTLAIVKPHAVAEGAHAGCFALVAWLARTSPLTLTLAQASLVLCWMTSSTAA